MCTISSLFTACWIFAVTAGAQILAPLDQGIGLFREGYREWNAAKMESALVQLRQDGSDTSLYWQAVAQFHIVLCRNESDAGETVGFIKDALRRKPHEAEFSIMLAVLYGRQIAARPVRGVWLGRKVNALRDAALAEDRDNPRVQTLAGVCWMKAPEPHRNRTLALEHLKRAAELFAVETAADRDFREPRWGACLCYTCLGDLMVEKGDISAARHYYRDALRDNALYRPAQKGLQELENEETE